MSYDHDLRRLPTLKDVAGAVGADIDATSKQLHFYDYYESYFAPLRDAPVTLLEVGVHKGGSTRALASYFRRGTIVAIDIQDYGLDWSGFPNIVFARCDQRSKEQLDQVCAAHAPDGIDIVIDDASHYGAWSLATHKILYPKLKPGGLYAVEDWATGYWDDWPDGSRFQEYEPVSHGGHIERRLPSHDGGMVGFIKRLVDEIPRIAIPNREGPHFRHPRYEFMHINGDVVIMKKVATPPA
jgi:hypothetical protein